VPVLLSLAGVTTSPACQLYPAVMVAIRLLLS
jgi:hypothetical protein